MAAMSSLEAVRRKIRSLQEQADAAEERAGRLQREVDQERALREEVGPPSRGLGALGAGLGARLPRVPPRPVGPAAASFAAVSDKMVVTCRAGRGVGPQCCAPRLGNPSAAWGGPRCGAQRDCTRCAGQQQNPELE